MNGKNIFTDFDGNLEWLDNPNEVLKVDPDQHKPVKKFPSYNEGRIKDYTHRELKDKWTDLLLERVEKARKRRELNQTIYINDLNKARVQEARSMRIVLLGCLGFILFSLAVFNLIF